MKRNKIEKNKFDPVMIINTPIESPYRVYKTYIVLKNVYDDFLNPKNRIIISTLKSRFEWPCF
jgi:hypothetical protein